MLGPVFILGTTRSGTSSLQTGLLAACGYAGYGEGHLVQLLYNLFDETERFYTFSEAVKIKGTMAQAVPEDSFRQHLYALVRDIYAEKYPTVFSDKTPTIKAIRFAPVVQEIWPSARFIYCQRRGIENVISKRKKFPDMSFSACCGEWRESFLYWQRTKELLNDKLFIEQFDMATKQHDVVARIGAFLDLDQDKIEKLAEFLSKNKLQRSSESYERIPLSETPWTESERVTFETVCGDAMKLAGYQMES